MNRALQNPDLKRLSLLTLGALGVVYGDIGTSPLYALRECFSDRHGLAVTNANVLGILSLIFWSLVVVVSIKYVLYILRADNRGEGGILALMALASQKCGITDQKRLTFLIVLGIFGAALLYGDGIITPAITVLGAVEGLKVITPFFNPYVVPIAVVIICLLFFAQRFGSGRIGIVFGPIMLLWFLTLGLLGLMNIPKAPEVLQAVNPFHAIEFFLQNGRLGFFVLADVLLVITGAEALYADMGHFGKTSIRFAWFGVALPGLVINYFGQGALILENSANLQNPFYLMAPSGLILPLVVLATMAAVIASQALISGVFSISRQAIQLGFFPRLLIKHTSADEIGQIYIPFINWSLLIGTVWIVISFKTSSSLSSAYGIAISTMMVITTLLAAIVAKRIFKLSMLKISFVMGGFLLVDLCFFGATVTKINEGGWLPLSIALALFIIMTTWKRGREILVERLAAKTIPFDKFLEEINIEKIHRVSGTAIFMTGDPTGTPPALMHNVRHNKILHERILLLTARTEEVPYVSMNERVDIVDLGHNIYRVIVRSGFQETPNIRKILKYCEAKGLNVSTEDLTFFVGRETLIATNRPGMALWREKLFIAMSKNALNATSFFRIPSDKVIEVGIQVDM